MYLKYPVDYINITNDYSVNHTAIDLGWNTKTNENLYACGNGIVTDIYYFTEGGNTLKIKYDNNFSTEFMHIRDNTINVKIGDRVSLNQKVAEMGSTGTQVTGPHVHVILRNENDVRVDPKQYLYVYNDQTVSEKSKNLVLYYDPMPIILDPTKRNYDNNQIEIKINNLRVRENPGLDSKILGFIKSGIHNYYDKQTKDNYDWYKIEDNKWIAYSDVWAILYPKTQNCEDTLVLKEEIIKKDEEIKSLKEKLANYEDNNYVLVYSCNKTDTYAIKLYNGEKLYLKAN